MKTLFALLSLISLSVGTMSVAAQTPTADQKQEITA